MFSKRSRWFKYFCGLTVTLTFALLIVVVIIKFWLGPAYATKKFSAVVSRFWDGVVHVEKTHFSLLKPLELEGVTLSDNDGNRWARAKTVKITLANWPSLKPRSRDIEIDSFRIQLHLGPNDVAIPLKRPSLKSADRKGRSPALEMLTVDDCSVYLADACGGEPYLNGLSLLAKKRGDSYDISLMQRESEDSEALAIEGKLHPATSQASLSLKMNRRFERHETAFLIALLNGSTDYEGQGDITVDVNVTGSLNDPNSINAVGKIYAADWNLIGKNEELIADDLSATANFSGRRIDVNSISAIICGGRSEGTFYVDYGLYEPLKIGGEFAVKDLNLPELTAKLGTSRKFTRGTVEMQYVFTVDSWKLESLSSSGFIAVNDADLRPVPLISYIFRTVGLVDYELLRMSDAAVAFKMSGPVLEFKEAHVANSYAALEVEPGGTVNMQTGFLDFHVVAVPIKLVRDIMKNLPVVGLFIGLKDKLTRFSVRGHWSDPPDKLIKKRAVEDVKEGVLDFFVEAARTGGQITNSMLSGSGTVIEAFKKDDLDQ